MQPLILQYKKILHIYLIYKNNTIIDYIKSFYDTFMREDFQETVNLFMDVLKEASDAGETMAKPKPPTVH